MNVTDTSEESQELSWRLLQRPHARWLSWRWWLTCRRGELRPSTDLNGWPA